MRIRVVGGRREGGGKGAGCVGELTMVHGYFCA